MIKCSNDKGEQQTSAPSPRPPASPSIRRRDWSWTGKHDPTGGAAAGRAPTKIAAAVNPGRLAEDTFGGENGGRGGEGKPSAMVMVSDIEEMMTRDTSLVQVREGKIIRVLRVEMDLLGVTTTYISPRGTAAARKYSHRTVKTTISTTRPDRPLASCLKLQHPSETPPWEAA